MYQIVGEVAFVILCKGRKRMQTRCSCHLMVTVFIIDFKDMRGRLISLWLYKENKLWD
jgi:hypothetical protein